jgi:hypothetical protein
MPAQHKLRILHISDLHARGSDRGKHERWRRHRVLGDQWQVNLDELLNDGPPFDLVCFTGDLADWGRPSEYSEATEFIVRQILEPLRVPRSRFFIVPGNHDVQRNTRQDIWTSMREAAARSAPVEFSRWLAGEKPPFGVESGWAEALLTRQRPFWDWVAASDGLGRPELLPSKSPHGRLGYRVRVELPDLPFPVHLVGLDSSWMSGDDNDQGKLRLTEDQVGILCTQRGEALPGFRLALVHHPIDHLSDSGPCARLLADYADLLLRGHLHEPSVSEWADPDGSLRQIAAGCLYEGEQGNRWPNSFQVIDAVLDDRGRPLRFKLRFRSWSPKAEYWHDDGGVYRQAKGGRLNWSGARAASEPIGHRSSSLHWVPALPAHHLQRWDQLAWLRAALLLPAKNGGSATTPQPVALRGMSGAGKSVLAAEFCRLDETLGVFGDGVIWIHLGPNPDLRQCLANVGSALGETEPAGSLDLRAAGDRLGRLIAAKACFLVLDDLWEVAHAELILNALGPRCGVLITTREGAVVTSVGARECSVGSLGEQDALKLLADWAGTTLEDMPLEASLVARRCGRHPLTLALCGALAADGVLWSDILRAWTEADLTFLHRELPNYAYPDALRAVETSVGFLRRQDQQTAELYAKLVVFVGVESIPASTVLMLWSHCGATDLVARKALVGLERKSLLRLDGPPSERRIYLHDLHQDYLRTRHPATPASHAELLNAYRSLCPNGWHLGPRDGYFFRHIHRHLFEAEWQEQLYELARSDDFLRVQAQYATPEGPLATLVTALRAAAIRDDPLGMAEFAVTRARRIAALAKESVFDAIQTGSLDSAWAIADQCPPEVRVVSHLLLASHLADRDRRDDALRTLERLGRGELPRLSKHGTVAALLLPHVLDLAPAMFEALGKSLLPQTSFQSELGFALARGGHFEAALRAAQEAGSLKAGLLETIVKYQARRGDLPAATAAAESMDDDGWHREAALSEVATAYAWTGDLRSSWRIANGLKQSWWRTKALAGQACGAAFTMVPKMLAAAEDTLNLALHSLPKTEADEMPPPRRDLEPNDQTLADTDTLIRRLMRAEAETSASIAIAQAMASISLARGQLEGEAKITFEAALGLARAHALPERKAQALASIVLVQQRFGRHDEAVATFSEAVDAARLADSPTRFAALAGVADILSSDSALAGEMRTLLRGALDQALVDTHRDGPLVIVARALLDIGDRDGGRVALAAALSEAGKSEDIELQEWSKAMSMVGVALAESGDDAEAHRAFAVALKAAEDIRSEEPQFSALSEISQYAADVRFFVQAVDAAKAIRWPGKTARRLANIAVLQAKNEPDQARATLAEALDLAQSTGLEEVAAAQVLLANREEGRQSFEQCIAKAKGESPGPIRDWLYLVPIVEKQIDAALVDDAVKTAELLEGDYWKQVAQSAIAIGWARAGKPERALEAAAATRNATAQTLAKVAAILAAGGDAANARLAMRMAQGAMQDIRPASPSEALAWMGYAQVWLEDVPEATTSFEDAVRYSGAAPVEERDSVLSGIASRQVDSGLIEGAVQTAEKLASGAGLRYVLTALAARDARDAFKRILPTCSSHIDAAYHAVGLLAKLYLAQAKGLEEFLEGHRPDRDITEKRQVAGDV